MLETSNIRHPCQHIFPSYQCCWGLCTCVCSCLKHLSPPDTTNATLPCTEITFSPPSCLLLRSTVSLLCLANATCQHCCCTVTVYYNMFIHTDGLRSCNIRTWMIALCCHSQLAHHHSIRNLTTRLQFLMSLKPQDKHITRKHSISCNGVCCANACGTVAYHANDQEFVEQWQLEQRQASAVKLCSMLHNLRQRDA